MICSSMETTMECLREVQGKTALTFPVCHGQPLANFIWTFRMPAAFFSRSLPLENTLNRMEKSCCRCPFRFIMLSAMDFISAALSMNVNSLLINVKHGCNEKASQNGGFFCISFYDSRDELCRSILSVSNNQHLSDSIRDALQRSETDKTSLLF